MSKLRKSVVYGLNERLEGNGFALNPDRQVQMRDGRWLFDGWDEKGLHFLATVSRLRTPNGYRIVRWHHDKVGDITL